MDSRREPPAPDDAPAPRTPETPPVPSNAEDDIILLEDLAPRTDVRGGRANRVFGENGGEPD
jgi:hypothetical protein